MKINFNVTGTERKGLVAAIGTELNSPAKYLGMPTAAYEVGDYHIDKHGTLIGEENSDLVARLAELGFVGETEETAETEWHTYRAELSDPETPDRMEIFSASNDIEAYEEAQELCTGEIVLLELHRLNDDYDVDHTIDIPALIAEHELYDTFVVETLKTEAFTDERIQNLLKLIESKKTLLTKALGGSLEIEDCGDTLQFIFPYSEEFGIGEIYGQLAFTMFNYVKQHQRVSSTEKEVESEKFAMRTFLVKIGMKGAEYSTTRKWLCRNLTGNASFASNAKYAEMQAKRRKSAEIVCQYCGGDNGGESADLLCKECRETFGHALYSEL